MNKAEAIESIKGKIQTDLQELRADDQREVLQEVGEYIQNRLDELPEETPVEHEEPEVGGES